LPIDETNREKLVVWFLLPFGWLQIAPQNNSKIAPQNILLQPFLPSVCFLPELHTFTT
jgi:hypothetical protein